MSALLPAAFYGLRVPGGDVAVEADIEFPAAIRITMAAIDTSEEYEPEEGDPPKSEHKRCVLKIIRLPYSLEDEDDSEFDSDEEDQLRAIINGDMSESDEDSDDEEVNGGPSDPEKSKKARREAAAKALKAALESAGDDDMAVDSIDAKGKGKIIALDESDESDDDDDEDAEIEEFVLCTLDPDNHYQQPLDFTIGEKEQVLFKVTGNFSINLTGNYVMPVDDRRPGYNEEEDDEYDLSPDEDELDLEDLEDSEEDELDDLEDPRIMEVDSDDEEPPKLVDTSKKGKKRPAESDDDEKLGLDGIIEKALKADGKANGEPKLSKKQQKKLKNNAGQAVAAAGEEKGAADTPASKKVQFAKNLEQGPTGSTKQDTKKDATKESEGATTKIRKVEGVSIDERKAGKGPAAKKGSRVNMRYIGKLQDGKVFDSNKSGKPFSFKLGTGEVIKGWDIGLDGIQAGAERRLTIPADKAYGKKALPGIPANSTLIFDVKCIEVK